MAKKQNTDYQNLDLFPEDAKIVGLGIQKFEVKSGEISALLTGVTNKTDIAQLDDICWRKAIAAWLVELCGNDGDAIGSFVDEARAIAREREEELRLTQEAMKRVQQFPANAGGALA